MKTNKVFILVIALLLVAVMGITGCGKKELEEESYLVTLDINPSVELEIKADKVIKARALNEDANEYIEGLEGKSLDDSFDIIVKRVGEHNLASSGNITIIVGVENNNKKVSDKLKEVCDNNGLHAIIVVPEITEEAKAEAEARGVTAAKAAYIQEIVQENENVPFEELINKPASELIEMKETGKYCDSGYTLVGDSCEKAIREERPEQSKVCPEGYEEVNNKCYLKGEIIEEPYCKNGLELKDGKCVGTDRVDAKATCATGTYNSKTVKCEVLTYVSDGTKKCNDTGFDPQDKMMSNGKCSRGKPVIPEGCPDAVELDGWCYNPSGDYEANVTCPSGSSIAIGDKGKACYKSETSDATYSCTKGTLDGNKCVVESSKNPEHRASCEDNFKLYDNRVCVDYSNSADFIVGNRCDNDARLEEDRCVYYEVVDAKE